MSSFPFRQTHKMPGSLSQDNLPGTLCASILCSCRIQLARTPNRFAAKQKNQTFLKKDKTCSRCSAQNKFKTSHRPAHTAGGKEQTPMRIVQRAQPFQDTRNRRAMTQPPESSLQDIPFKLPVCFPLLLPEQQEPQENSPAVPAPIGTESNFVEPDLSGVHSDGCISLEPSP